MYVTNDIPRATPIGSEYATAPIHSATWSTSSPTRVTDPECPARLSRVASSTAASSVYPGAPAAASSVPTRSGSTAWPGSRSTAGSVPASVGRAAQNGARHSSIGRSPSNSSGTATTA